MDNNCKLQYFFGCGKYDANPPICCKILCKLGIYFGIRRYFSKRNMKIYPK